MSRHQVVVCDLCGNPTEQIAGKICFVPQIPGVTRKMWSNYSHTADVGMCCKDKLFKQVNFRKRMTKEEYRESRKRRSHSSTVKATNTGSNGA